MPKIRVLALLTVLALALAGCAPTVTLPTPSLTPPAESEGVLNPELVPQLTSGVTAENAAAESARLVEAIQALIDPALIAGVEDQSQLVPAQDDLPAYFAYFRQLSLTDSTDALTLAEALSAVLDQSGWTLGQTAEEGGLTVWPLASTSESAQWFVFIGAGAAETGQSVVTVTIGSPDIA